MVLTEVQPQFLESPDHTDALKMRSTPISTRRHGEPDQVVSRETLRRRSGAGEIHNLVVRVSGISAYFRS
jgi:hypothetical protein